MDLIDGYIPLRWPDRSRGPYYAQLKMQSRDGRFEVVALAVGSVKDDLPISGTVLREVRVAELAKEVADLLLRLDVSSRLEAGPLIDDTDQEGRPLDAAFHEQRERFWEPGRVAADKERAAMAAVPATPPRHDDAGIARIYLGAFARHQAPTKAVAEALGISQAAAAKRVWRIRRAGLLPETKQGRATGQAGQRRTRE
jgi:hypothetical protein